MSFMGRIFGSPRDRFGKHILAQVLAFEGVDVAEYDPDSYEITYRCGSAQAKLSLDILFRRFDGEIGPELEQAVAELLEPIAAGLSPDSWEYAEPRLRPVLRQAGLARIGLGEFHGQDVVLGRPAVPYLNEMVVVDMPTTIRFVTVFDLRRWEVDADQVFATAHGNLTELAINTMAVFAPSERTQVLEYPDDDGDTYVGSLPLIPGWLAGAGARTGAQALVFLSGHLGMFITIGATDELVNSLLAVADQRYDDALRPLSPLPYTVDEDGVLVPYRVPRNHPVWPALRHAEAKLAVAVYGPQTEMLRADEEVEAVASALLHVRGPNGIEHTMTPWSAGGPTLLPKADYIVFVNDDGETLRLAWEDVSEYVDLPVAPGFDPPRYLVPAHPAEPVMARLRTLAALTDD
ncbi:hypothetical protein [Nocardia sp. NPDC020380]|uniref:hypothetical protein n=1 Tax=Nocardia sp. NPDC020380 TaxID=3364309 RepID=UPI00378ABFD9